MANFYSKKISNTQNFEPSRETIDFLLNYSKALSVINYKEVQFESILN